MAMEGEGLEAPEGNAIDEQSLEEDNRQAMQIRRAPDGRIIDEQSPDEDERQARLSLRAPKRKRVILSGVSLKSEYFKLFTHD